MSRQNLAVLGLDSHRADTHLVVQASTQDDRYFPPLLAARILLDVAGLVRQRCYSRPGSVQSPRRWAFAQEIYSNQGRGTEAGHFLEHLVLEMLLESNGARPFTAETTWDFSREPDLYRIRFRRTHSADVERALARAATILGRHQYHIELETPSRPAPLPWP